MNNDMCVQKYLIAQAHNARIPAVFDYVSTLAFTAYALGKEEESFLDVCNQSYPKDQET